jgi:hypothetical protein
MRFDIARAQHPTDRFPKKVRKPQRLVVAKSTVHSEGPSFASVLGRVFEIHVFETRILLPRNPQRSIQCREPSWLENVFS